MNSHVSELLKQGYKPTPEDEKAQLFCSKQFFQRFLLGSVVGAGSAALLLSRTPRLRASMWRVPTYVTGMIVGGQVGLAATNKEACVEAAMNVDSPLGAALRESMRATFPRAFDRVPEELRSKRFEDYHWVPDPAGVATDARVVKKRPPAPLGLDKLKPFIDPEEEEEPKPVDPVDEMDREVEAERRAAETERLRWASDRDGRTERRADSRRHQPPEDDDFRRPAWRDAAERRRGGGGGGGDSGESEGGPRRFFDDEQEQEARRFASSSSGSGSGSRRY